MHTNVKVFFDAVSNTAVISLLSINPAQKQFQDVQLGLLHHHIKFTPYQIKSMQENEANRFCFALTL